MPRSQRIKDITLAFEELRKALNEAVQLVDIVIVEGQRDIIALKHLGFRGRLEICSHKGISDMDFVDDIARNADSVLILTDFDEKGSYINNRLKRLFERRGIKVDTGLRLRLKRLMAIIGTYTVEALNNIHERI